MRLSTVLDRDRVKMPLSGSTLSEAASTLLETLGGEDALPASAVEELAQRFSDPDEAEVSVRLVGDVALVATRSSEAPEIMAALGVAPGAIELPDGTTARAVLLLVTPHKLTTLQAQVVPALARVLREEPTAAALLRARSAEAVLAIERLMSAELHGRLRVEDALVPVSYRVYPDTPIAEIIDLMTRRTVRAVPVVGEKYEVLGIITTGDALKHLLPRRMTGERESQGDPSMELTARDVMTRSVMCVAEDQSLLEVAHLMVNKNVEQLPVVREGELIGFVTRDVILSKLMTD